MHLYFVLVLFVINIVFLVLFGFYNHKFNQQVILQYSSEQGLDYSRSYNICVFNCIFPPFYAIIRNCRDGTLPHHGGTGGGKYATGRTCFQISIKLTPYSYLFIISDLILIKSNKKYLTSNFLWLTVTGPLTGWATSINNFLITNSK